MPLFAPRAVNFAVVLVTNTAGGYRDVLQVADAPIGADGNVCVGASGESPIGGTDLGCINIVGVQAICFIGPPTDHDADLAGRAAASIPGSNKNAGFAQGQGVGNVLFPYP